MESVPTPLDRAAAVGADVGREVAFRELFLAFYGRLAGWAGRLVDDPDTAHEVATEAFVRLYGRWGTVHEPRAWLYMTAGNIVRDHWRKLGRERVAYRRVGVAEEAYEPPDAATTLTVRELVEALPDRLRAPVLLHYYADLSVRQVASVLGKPEGTIKRHLFDARGLMARELRAAEAP